jgi:hypothetical protein
VLTHCSLRNPPTITRPQGGITRESNVVGMKQHTEFVLNDGAGRRTKTDKGRGTQRTGGCNDFSMKNSIQFPAPSLLTFDCGRLHLVTQDSSLYDVRPCCPTRKRSV